MHPVDPRWSLEWFHQHHRPHASWKGWFTEAYQQAMLATDPEERLLGWKAAATIFGDMHVPVACLFVSYHGRTLVPDESPAFVHNINLCFYEMGFARLVPKKGEEGRDVDPRPALRWMDEQLQPFEGDLAAAAGYAMRRMATRFGLLIGPDDPSIVQLTDGLLWSFVGQSEEGDRP